MYLQIKESGRHFDFADTGIPVGMAKSFIEKEFHKTSDGFLMDNKSALNGQMLIELKSGIKIQSDSRQSVLETLNTVALVNVTEAQAVFVNRKLEGAMPSRICLNEQPGEFITAHNSFVTDNCRKATVTLTNGSTIYIRL